MAGFFSSLPGDTVGHKFDTPFAAAQLKPQPTTGVLAIGLHTDIPAAAYHADPCADPSLSSSVADILVKQTPRHAWFAHPRLNTAMEPDEGNVAMALGSVVHELVLGRGGGIEIVDADDWRTKAAKEARAAATEAGRTAVLRKTMAEAEVIQNAVLDHLGGTREFEDFAFDDARSEVVGIWRDIGGPLCRMMIDRLTPAGTVYDLKVTGRGLDGRTLGNALEDGYALRAAFYLRGLARLAPEMAGRFRYRWIFVESTAPYCVRVVEPDARTLALGDRLAALAIEKWRLCLASGDWPGYPRRVERIGMADWAERRILEREEEDPDAARMVVSDSAPIAEPSSDFLIYGERRIPLSNEAQQ